MLISAAQRISWSGHQLRVGLLLAGAVLTSCGKVQTIAPPDAGPDASVPDAPPADPCAAPILPENFASCLAPSLCDIYTRCDLADFSAFNCEEVAIFTLSNDTSLLAFSEIVAQLIAQERVTYDGNAAAACIETIDSLECKELFGSVIDDNFITELCPGVFNGTRGPGQSCAFDVDCSVEGSRCLDPNNPYDEGCSLDQVCVSPVAVGQVCDNEVPCVEGAHCTYVSSANDTNEICRDGGANALCASNRHCDLGFFCNASDRCTAQRTLNQTCNDWDECAGELDCVDGVCADVSTVGARCALFCAEGLDCMTQGDPMNPTCQPNATTGSVCVDDSDCNGVFFGFRVCNAGFCEDILEPGSVCVNDVDCRFDLFCNADILGTPEGNCVPRLDNGETCVADTNCEGARCSAGTCINYPICNL